MDLVHLVQTLHTALLCMHIGKPFIYEPREYAVTATEAADLVTHEGADDHQFRVNPQHQSPSLTRMRELVADLGLGTQDGEAFLMQRAVLLALDAADQGRYGVGALLARVHSDIAHIVESAINERVKGGPYEYTGHAEMRLVDKSTPYMQRQRDRTHDVAAVNLCPCPGCMGHMVDAHWQTVLIGSIDPRVGAAFLRDLTQRYALGDARQQVFEARNLEYRFPRIEDEDLRSILLTASWDVFHATRKGVHKTLHRSDLQE